MRRGILSDDPMWEAFGGRALGRIAAGGAELGECLAAVEATGAGGAYAWLDAWGGLAARLDAAAESSLAAGRRVSAREAWLRAATYHHVSYMPLFGAPVDPRMAAAARREAASFQGAAALHEPPIEVLEIPFEGATLPAYFAKVDGSGRPRPTLVCTNGYDSNIQEMFFAQAPAAVRRGYNCLLFDGPGQGRVLIEQGLPMRPDWETVVRPVIDYALTREEIDPRRIALVGWSFGGFLAPRAAAFERRIAALIADPGQGDHADQLRATLPLDDAGKTAFPDVPPSSLDGMAAWLAGPEGDPSMRWKLLRRGPFVHGATGLFAYLKALCDYRVLEVAGDIACPTLLTAAEDDPGARSGEALFAALRVENKRRIVFTVAEGAGGHCEAFARGLYHQRVFDWLDAAFALPPGGET